MARVYTTSGPRDASDLRDELIWRRIGSWHCAWDCGFSEHLIRRDGVW